MPMQRFYWGFLMVSFVAGAHALAVLRLRRSPHPLSLNHGNILLPRGLKNDDQQRFSLAFPLVCRAVGPALHCEPRRIERQGRAIADEASAKLQRRAFEEVTEEAHILPMRPPQQGHQLLFATETAKRANHPHRFTPNEGSTSTQHVFKIPAYKKASNTYDYIRFGKRASQ